MAVVQSTYSENIAVGYPGMVANEMQMEADTRIVEPTSGIPFGRACGQGSADKGVKLGGTLATFVGVSLRDVTLAPVSADSDYLDEIPYRANAAIMTRGDVWVETGGAVAIGGVVHYNATTGVLDDSGGSGPIPGARWMTSTTEAGLAILRLSGLQRT